MRAILALAVAFATFSPSVLAGVPTLGDAIREYDRARKLVGDQVDFAHAEIVTDVEGAEVGGVLLIEGRAWVDEGFHVGAIRFYVDGVYVGDGGRGERWAYELDTRRLIDGVHAFSVSVVATPVPGGATIVGYSGGDRVQFRTLNHVTGVVLHEATYEGLDARTHLWSTTLDQDYVGLRMTVTTTPDPDAPLPVPHARSPLYGEAVAAYTEPWSPTDEPPKKTWVATFGVLHGGAVTVTSRAPHDLLKEGSTLALAGGFVGDGTITIRIEAVPWP